MLAAFALFLSALAPVGATSIASSPRASTPSCRCISSDACWPSTDKWSMLNSTVGGRLVATVPIGQPCHDPKYNAASCANLQKAWTEPQTHCSPFTAENTACTLGNYVHYAVNVSTPADIVAAVKFAKANNVRLVVRNTGHDLSGRSTGSDSLAVWTYYLKDTQVYNYTSSYYTGPVVKAGAGVSGALLHQRLDPYGLVPVTGECPTVGTVGGYSQGGGHSALSTFHGLGADQVLEYQVVTTDGNIVTAKPGQNEDLYWALSGGGGGTYGIVVSAVISIYKTAQVTAASFTLMANSTTSDKYSKAVSAFLQGIPKMADKGASVIYLHTPVSFLGVPVTVFNATSDYARNVVFAPWQSVLKNLGVAVNVTYVTYPTYHDFFTAEWGPLPYGYFPVETNTYGSRLMPRSVVENGDTFPDVEAKIVATGALSVGFAGSFLKPANRPDNAVLPAWRNTSIHVELQLPFNESDWAASVAAQDTLSNKLVPMLDNISPGSGTYINEAGWEQTNWKENFFGANYDKLLSIKKKWDPSSMLYGLKLVGSDEWYLDSQNRLCKAT